MKSLSAIHISEILAGGYAVANSFEYAQALAEAVSRHGVTVKVSGTAGKPPIKVEFESRTEGVTPPQSAGGPLAYPASERTFTKGDLVDYCDPCLVRDDGTLRDSLWHGSEVTGRVKRPPYAGQYYVKAPGGEIGIIPPEKLRPHVPESPLAVLEAKYGPHPLSRSKRHTLVGTYEIVIEGAGRDPKPWVRYKRLGYTSVPSYVKDDQQLADTLTDALNDVARIEHELDPAAVFSVLGADTFEADQEEGIVI
jgi:hypothetical protein